MADMIVRGHKKGEYIIVEQPKQSRNNGPVAHKKTAAAPPVVNPEPEAEEEVEETETENSVPINTENMSQLELKNYINKTEDVEVLKKLTSHALKTISTLAQNRINQLNNK